MQHTPFLVAAAFATALMGHTGQLPDFSGLDAVGEAEASDVETRSSGEGETAEKRSVEAVATSFRTL